MRTIEHEGFKLAVYVPREEVKKGLNFYSKDNDFIQVGTWGYDKGKILPPHIHNTGVTRKVDRTQEVIHVIEGRVKALIFSEDERPVGSIVVERGDTLALFAGGHSYEILDDDTCVLEVKNGPYVGPDLDRRRFTPASTSLKPSCSMVRNLQLFLMYQSTVI